MVDQFDIVSNSLGLVFSAVASTVAAWYTLRGAVAGVWQHRFPRMLVGVAVSVIACSYWIEILSDESGVQMRRGAGWVLWPALAWTAWSGIRYQKDRAAEAEAIRREHENGGY